MPLKKNGWIKKPVWPELHNLTIDSGCVGEVCRTEDAVEPIMTDAERERLAEIAKGMSEQEILVFLENIPAELCMKRVELELAKGRAFAKAVNTALRIVE